MTTTPKFPGNAPGSFEYPPMPASEDNQRSWTQHIHDGLLRIPAEIDVCIDFGRDPCCQLPDAPANEFQRHRGPLKWKRMWNRQWDQQDDAR
jgi:hypothetical protein